MVKHSFELNVPLVKSASSSPEVPINESTWRLHTGHVSSRETRRDANLFVCSSEIRKCCQIIEYKDTLTFLLVSSLKKEYVVQITPPSSK
jgi:hypothetical protein